MRVSLTAFGLAATDYVPVAQAAERLGFDALWVADHLITPSRIDSPYPYSATGSAGYPPSTPLADVWVTLGQLAATTTTLRLGTGVLVLPIRHPILTARAAATAQDASSGRLLLGVGVGWMREEFEALGASFGDRGRRTDEMIKVMRLLWTGGPVMHDGIAYHFDELQMAPRPSEQIPVIVGGTSRKALERAAALGDGWFGPVCSLEASMELRDQLVRLPRRRPAPLELFPRLDGGIGPAALRRFEDAGFDQVVVSMGGALDPSASERRDPVERVERLSEALALSR